MLLRWLLFVLLASRPTKYRAAEELAKTAAAVAASEDDKEAAVFANRRGD